MAADDSASWHQLATECLDQGGPSLLCFSIHSGHASIVKMLLEAKANVNVTLVRSSQRLLNMWGAFARFSR